MQAKHDKLAAWFVSHGGYLDPAVEFAFDQSCGVFLRHKADREDDEHTLQVSFRVALERANTMLLFIDFGH